MNEGSINFAITCLDQQISHKGKVSANTDMKSLLRNLDKETFVFDLKTPIEDINQFND